MFLADDVTIKLYDEAMVEEEFGVPPHKLGDYLALVGDVSDNIAGIPGVGGKSAALILKEYGSINGLFGAAETGNHPWTELKSLNRCATAISKFFNEGTIELQCNRLGKNRVLVGLKTDLPVDMEDVLRERKVEKLTNESEPEAMDAVFIGEPEEKKKETTAIAVKGTEAIQQFDASMNPTGMAGLYWLAKRAVDARMYSKFSNVDMCLMAMLRGKDFGLSPTASLETLHVIDGKVCLPASFVVSLARKHPDCEYVDAVEIDDVHCKVETKRKSSDKVYSATFTIEEAKTAGLVKPRGAWEKYAQDMLYARAMTRLCRRIWTEALCGSYAVEEMQES